MRILVDGDLLVYRCGFAAERTEYKVVYHDEHYDEPITVWAENHKGAIALAASLTEQGHKPDIEKHVNLEPVQNALHNVKSMIDKTCEALDAGAKDVTICLSGSTNYRTDLATLREYKGNRDPDHKPAHGPAIKDYMRKQWDSVVTVDEEADDWLGYTQYASWQDMDTVIVSLDKDLDMIPGLHYNFVKDQSYFVDEDAANAFFWTQLVMGDSTDNIPGVPGVGPKKAEKFMEPCWHWSNSGEFDEDHAFHIAYALYVQGYGPEKAFDALVENGQLLWIRREEGQVWLPPEYLSDSTTLEAIASSALSLKPEA
jgi:hypothetical protein